MVIIQIRVSFTINKINNNKSQINNTTLIIKIFIKTKKIINNNNQSKILISKILSINLVI
jgi:hypothetical protein